MEFPKDLKQEKIENNLDETRNVNPESFKKDLKRHLTDEEICDAFKKRYHNRYFKARDLIFVGETFKYCPNDNTPLFEHGAIHKEKIIENVMCCPTCDTIFIKREGPVEDFRAGGKILWVCEYVQACNRRKHRVKSATGILCKRDLSEVEINIQYCYNCDEYFITKQQYDSYKIIYRDLMGNLRFVDDLFYRNVQSDSQFNRQSPLNINGYNVNQISMLSEDERRQILGYVIDNYILSKSEVIEYLSMFIDNAEHKRNSDMSNAIAKWESDLKWVNFYKLEDQYKVPIIKIDIKPKKHR